MSRAARRHALGILAAGTAAAGSLALLRAWQRRWEASAEEVARTMPLDERIPEPTTVTNRAITIRALPEEIWPWLAQMGELPRGGFYSYLTVERLLGMEVENADRVLPEFQDPKVGDPFDRAGTMLVQAVEPNRCLVLGPPPASDLQTTWALALYPAAEGATRLVSRCRYWMPPTPRGILLRAILDPGQFLMERKMLLEIRKRAERT